MLCGSADLALLVLPVCWACAVGAKPNVPMSDGEKKVKCGRAKIKIHLSRQVGWSQSESECHLSN